MAQECGFFNAQMVGEEFDRVYLAEQFAAYFAAFIGNGVYGHSMQKLQVLCQDIPDMSIKVLSGEAYINGWWYRNTDTYNIQIPVADGVLSRIDVVVVRWGKTERDMWLQLITGTPSLNPVKPDIRRDADYYDLQLATINVSAGSIHVTQSQIKDTRLDNSVCGLVTGVVDQIDTTNLYNQFESYFQEFKNTYEADYDNWTKEQKQAYFDYISITQNNYDNWVSNKESDYNQWTSEKKYEYSQFVIQAESDYNQWTAEQKAEYREWYDIHTKAWTQEFTKWFEDIKDKLTDDVTGSLQLQIDSIWDVVNSFEPALDSDIDNIINGTYVDTDYGVVTLESTGAYIPRIEIISSRGKEGVILYENGLNVSDPMIGGTYYFDFTDTKSPIWDIGYNEEAVQGTMMKKGTMGLITVYKAGAYWDTHGMGKPAKFKLKVPGSCKIMIGGCKFSGDNDKFIMSSTTGTFDELEKMAKTVNCYDVNITNGSDRIIFTYTEKGIF